MSYSWLCFYLAVISSVALGTILIDLLIGVRSIKRLKAISIRPTARPRISIVVAARNEEQKIEAGLGSLLMQDYHDFEVILVNDRSTDSTASIARRLSQRFPSLKVLDVAKLPDGWLGKNHALYLGASHASGELLLFTDADVVMRPDTITRASAYFLQELLDHLALTPEVRVPGTLLNIVVGGFTIFFSIFARPWKAPDPKSAKHIGIGAFNMIRKDIYERIGTHKAIALRPDDDLKLGKLVKKHGYRQELLSGADLLWVEWYASLGQMVDGLMKNSFSGLEYRLWLVPVATMAQFFLFVWPFLGTFLTTGTARWLNMLMCVALVSVCAYHAALFRAKPLYALGIPIASLVMTYIIWKSTLTTLFNGGISWRGTHYPLEKLRANKV